MCYTIIICVDYIIVNCYDINNMYRVFIFNSLLQLGLSPSCKGTYYLRDIIILAIKYSDFVNIDINLKELYIILANEKNISYTKVNSCIEYAINTRNEIKTKTNFNNIFQLDYDIYFMTAKSIINLIVTLIYNTKSVT